MATEDERQSHAPARPAAAAGRILGFDVARSLAILGMVVVHFALVMAKDHSRPAWLVVVLGLLDGRAAATFVVLAGVGITLISRRAAAGGDPVALAQARRRTLVRRGLFLLALGFLNLTVWPGDILRVYGVSLLLAATMIAATSRRLLLTALAFAAGFIVLFLLLDFGKNWTWETMSYHGLWTPAGVVRNLFYDGFRSVFPWTGFILFGMWVGRLDLRHPRVNRRVLFAAAVAALAAEGASRLLVSHFLARPRGMDAETVKALVGTESMPALPLFLLAAGGAAVAVIALAVRAAAAWPSRVWEPLAATGQMALTWYVAHIVLGLGAVVALGLESSQSLTVAAGCGVGFFAVAVGVSAVWKRFFRHGPLEWVMRKVAG